MPANVPVPCRIFRIVHFDNLAGIIEQGGMWCGAEMERRRLDYEQIGLQGLTKDRADRPVPVGPKGNLCDYVPIYFCPRSVMLYQIHTGQVPTFRDGQEPILHLVTTVEKIAECQRRIAFTDRHAKTRYAAFYDDPDDLPNLDWEVIGSTQFAGTDDDPDRPTRKAAELLVHRFVPIDAILGIGVYSQKWKVDCETQLARACSDVRVKVNPGWYY
jgi:ssDNA thymidine ADP-ribosyltransferase, DarT